MSAIAEIVDPTDEGARMLVREFPADLTVGDGRTVDVRIVPYGERIVHNDGLGGVRPGVEYTEEFVAGVFAHQLRAANRVFANVEHEEGIAGVVGHGLELREGPDGFYGSFKIHDTPAGETALTLIRDGGLDGISVEALPDKSVRTSGGVVQRVRAHLRAVAFTRFAAYTGARVLAVREQAEIFFDEELLPTEMNPELVERLRAQGFALPDRYQAHPAETGTPAQTGTPEDGTRHTTATTSLRRDHEHDHSDGTQAPEPA